MIHSIGFTRLLSKYDSSGAIHDLQCTLQFSATVTEQVASAPDHHMEPEAAVQQAQAMTSQLQTGAPMIGQAATNINTMTAAVSAVTSTVLPWLPLLDKVKAFVEVVDGIAAVCHLVHHPSNLL